MKYCISVLGIVIFMLFFYFIVPNTVYDKVLYCNLFSCDYKLIFNKDIFWSALSAIGSISSFFIFGNSILTELTKDKEKIKAEIIDLYTKHNAILISLNIKNTGKIYFKLKFISNNAKDAIIEDNLFQPNKVKNPVFFNNNAYQYCIYMRRKNEMINNKHIWYDDNIILPPHCSENLELIISKGNLENEKLINYDGNDTFTFFTKKGTECTARWNKKAYREWKKNLEL